MRGVIRQKGYELLVPGATGDLDLRRFRGLYKTENSAQKGEHCHERTRPTHDRNEPELPRGEDGQCKMANLIRFADPAAVHGGRPH